MFYLTLDPSIRSYFHESEIQNFETISAMFRLGKFYQVDYFRDQALSRFEPTFLTYATRDLNLKARMSGMSVSTTINCINFARENELLWILPFAFTRLYRVSAKQLLMGVLRSDGTLVKLSPSDQHIAMTGIATLRVAEAKEMFGALLSTDNNCRHGPCLQARLEHATAVWSPVVMFEEKVKVQPLGKWQSEWGLSLCQTCCLNAQTEYEAGRNRVWEKLPSFFELPPWDELLNTQVSLYSHCYRSSSFLTVYTACEA